MDKIWILGHFKSNAENMFSVLNEIHQNTVLCLSHTHTGTHWAPTGGLPEPGHQAASSSLYAVFVILYSCVVCFVGHSMLYCMETVVMNTCPNRACIRSWWLGPKLVQTLHLYLWKESNMYLDTGHHVGTLIFWLLRSCYMNYLHVDHA